MTGFLDEWIVGVVTKVGECRAGFRACRYTGLSSPVYQGMADRESAIEVQLYFKLL